MADIFVSYRREDAEWPASRINDNLIQAFGTHRVFFDTVTIRPGEDFAAVIRAKVGGCRVLLAVIGPRWLDTLDRRLKDDNDYVRIEIAEALRRDVLVVPVLIDGASLPPAKRLPAEISALSSRNAVQIRAETFPANMSGLIEFLKEFLDAAPASQHPFVPSTHPSTPLKGGTRFKDSDSGPEMIVLEALKRGDLTFQAPILPGAWPANPSPVHPPPPASKQASEQIAEVCALVEKFRVELAAERRYGNELPFIIDLIAGIGDLPDPSRWSEEHFDHLLNVQLALDNTFRQGDPDAGSDVIHFGVLAPLLQTLSALLDGRKPSDDYSVVVNDELVHYLNEIREAIRHLATADISPAVSYKVKVLDQYIQVVERSPGRRINLKRVDDMAGRIRQHRLGALHRIECLTAVLIGKRTDRAPNWAIFRDEFRGGRYGPELVIVRAGEFQMGSPGGDSRESPQHRVTIAKRLAAGACPVTRGEFATFVEDSNYDAGEEWRSPGFQQDDDHPVVGVSWHDAQAHVRWLTAQSAGRAYRLLSEAEWEYCCRAGTSSAYSTGSDITPAQANFGHRHQGTTSVFKFPPNAWRLRDMHGNVREWCEDSWHDDYTGNPPADGSVWAGGDVSLRVMRGGSWFNYPQDRRSASRNRGHPDFRYVSFGFRVARTL